jgi:hypothetical protein
VKLYEISAAILAAFDQTDDNGELLPGVEERLTELEGALNDKADNIAALMRTCEAEAAAYKTEADRLGQLAGSADGGGGLIAQNGWWGAWSESRSTGFVGVGLPMDTPVILCARANATDVYLDKNGLQVGTIARPAASGSTAQREVVGYFGAHTGDGVFDILEVVAYNKHMTVDERAFVLEYLNRRYGVF